MSDAQSEAQTKETRKLTLIDLEKLVELWIEHYGKVAESDKRLLPLKPIHYLAPVIKHSFSGEEARAPFPSTIWREIIPARIICTMTPLEQQFEDKCLSDVAEARQLGYNPSYFLKMVEEYGAVETARRLIVQEPLPEGFSRLWEMHRLDLTIEACVHDNPQFHALFDAQTLAACDARLASVEYIWRWT